MSARNDEKDLEIVHDQVADKLGAVQLEQVDKVITAAEWQQLLNDAQAAEEEEKNMPLKEAFRIYPMAMFWTFAVTVSFIM
jgi:SP family general alpha glucoside:H+ symporter-like MFS transporter